MASSATSKATSGAAWVGPIPKEDGVRCYHSSGDLIGKIHLPETCANMAFGGMLRNRLYICATTSIYACYVGVQGAARC